MAVSIWHMVKAAGKEFLADESITLAAAVSFYTALSFGPLLILLMWIGSSLGHDLEQRMIEQVEQLIGPSAGEAVRMVVENAQTQQSAATIAGILSIVALFFAASAVFAQLQKAMNKVWNVEAKPGQGLASWVRTRLLSMSMIVVIGFLLLVSMVVSAALSVVVPDQPIWQWVEMAASILIFVLLFAMMFKILPDVVVRWRDVWVGALITAMLLALGKFAIGKYLGYSSVGSAYGAAGSLVVLLVWVYYSALIVFFGAELTQQYARRFGERLAPTRHAQWTGAHAPAPAG